ncbi:C-type lectin domain family 10 member A-like [Ruditapes philippinarum]|uniref:C-type lectin domain family 10 member A-like n=1 Tax=Ruditapes philippinarum TaxID=129788 RepID=UPI00295C0EC6|nr:C-type lectin domain family 10 member A-like [Ruditapes philippinarum]
MWRSVQIFCVFYCSIVKDYVASECPNGWTYYESSCYFFGHSDVDFLDAERFCSHYGAHLVSIETANEGTFVKSYLADLKDPYHWIGLTDEIIEGQWKWQANDSTSNYTDWYPGQPDGHKGSNCAGIFANHRYQWLDVACTSKYRPLCEIPSNGETIIVG